MFQNWDTVAQQTRPKGPPMFCPKTFMVITF